MLRALEGFETKQHDTYLDRLYTRSGSVVAYVTGRKSGSALQASNLLLTTKALVGSPENTWIVGFALRKGTSGVVGGSATAGIQFRNSAGEQCSLVMIPGDIAGNFKLRLKRDSVTIATSGNFAWGALLWHYFMLKVTVRPGMDGVYELKHFNHLNVSTAVFSGSNVNLAHQGTDGADRVRISWDTNGGGNCAIDDIFVFDSTGALNNNFPALPVVIFGALPTSDGNETDWLPSTGVTNFDLVDDPASAPDDTDRVTSETVGDVDLYGYSDFGAVAAATPVIGVQVVSTVAMLASGSLTVRARVRSGADEAAGASQVVNGLALDSKRQCWDQNPTGTPAAWTKASVEAAQFGIEVEA